MSAMGHSATHTVEGLMSEKDSEPALNHAASMSLRCQKRTRKPIRSDNNTYFDHRH